MPILERVDAAADLAQGDLLREVSLHGGDAEGESFRLPETVALVVSRDCNALRDRIITVSPVREFAAQVPQGLNAEELSDFFASVRDGDTTPDRLYLGSLLDAAAAPRFQARLDQLCTLRLPEDPAPRAEWVRVHRVARLTPDFIRALPVRLFQAIARVGYDDVRWYSTQDLRWLLVQADAELAGRDAELAAKRSELARAQAADPHNTRRLAAAERDVKDAQNARDKLAEQFAQYRRELRVREEPAGRDP